MFYATQQRRDAFRKKNGRKVVFYRNNNEIIIENVIGYDDNDVDSTDIAYYFMPSLNGRQTVVKKIEIIELSFISSKQASIKSFSVKGSPT